jgi:hypothetical protein
MPLPGRDQTFAFASCRDMLTKLEREIERYALVDGKDVEAMKDLAFNIAVTAWHLCDWVFMDMTPQKRESLSIRSLREMCERAFTCRALQVFRQVATASKHWTVSKRPAPDVKVVVAAVPEWSIWFEDENGELPATEAFEQALSFWTAFIYQNEIGRDLDVVGEADQGP